MMNTVMMLIIEFIFLHSFYWISTIDIFRLDIKMAVEKSNLFSWPEHGVGIH